MDGLEQDYEGRLQVVRLNVNQRTNDAAIRALRVRGHPTVVFLNRGGVPQDPLIGEQTDAMLRPKVEALLGP